MYDRWKDPKAVEWSKKIKERDHFTCQLCGKYGVPLNSHHLFSWDFFVEKRYELSNGITLCSFEHDLYHQIYGRGMNTLYQFLQFKKTYKAFLNSLREIHFNVVLVELT